MAMGVFSGLFGTARCLSVRLAAASRLISDAIAPTPVTVCAVSVANPVSLAVVTPERNVNGDTGVTFISRYLFCPAVADNAVFLAFIKFTGGGVGMVF